MILEKNNWCSKAMNADVKTAAFYTGYCIVMQQ